MTRVSAVVIAAGASTRLGKPKQLVPLGGEAMLERSVRIAMEAGCSPVVVVLGSSAEQIQQATQLHGAQVAINHDWMKGMGSSIGVGIGVLRGIDGAVLMTCDMPSVTSAHLRALASTGEATGSSYAGRCGVPAYFPKSMFPQLCELKGDTGARQLLQSARSIELPGGALDVDTQEDVRIAQRLFG